MFSKWLSEFVLHRKSFSQVGSKGGERIISVGLLYFIYLRYEHESSRLFSLLDDFKLRPELFVGLRKVDGV